MTEPGARLFAALEPAFSDIERALETLNQFRETPFGTELLNVPSSIAAHALGKVIGPLLEKNPGLKLDVVATDHLVDIVKDGFDAGIRAGEKLSQDMIAVRIGPAFRFAVVGSPAHVARHGLPASPRGLMNHRCIRCKMPGGMPYFRGFENAGETLTVDVDGPVTFDNQELMLEAALAGVGLAYSVVRFL